MPPLAIAAHNRPNLEPYPITSRLRSQLVYFMTSPETPGLPPLGEHELWFAADEVAKWLEEGVFYLVSPLDTANMTEVELSEEQENLFSWLQTHQVEHVRLVGADS